MMPLLPTVSGGDDYCTLYYIIVINVFKKKTSTTLQELNAIEKMSFSRRLKTGSDVADLISWGSLSRQRTKAWSPVVERRVAGMASEDDAAERRYLRPGTSTTCLTSADR